MIVVPSLAESSSPRTVNDKGTPVLQNVTNYTGNMAYHRILESSAPSL